MTTTGQAIEIPLSKQKIILMLIGSIFFVALGAWFVLAPPAMQSGFWNDPVKIRLVGYACIVFFGLCAFFLIRKIRDNRPGLIIDSIGLVDNSSAVSAGRILWSDIEGLSVIEIHRQKLILIYTKNPEEYIDRQNSAFKRKIMAMNHKMYGTPISVSSNGISMPFDELLSVLTSRLNENKVNYHD